MKKILCLAAATLLIGAASFAQSTSPRFGSGSGDDNTGRTITQSFKAISYASTIALKPSAQFSTFAFAQLTGNVTITTTNTKAYAGDIIRLTFSADATNRVITFSTGFQSAGTVTVTASKYATVSFIFNGSTWVELSRSVTA